MPKRSLSILSIAIAIALACANPVDEKIAAARTTADVTRAMGSEPACAPADAESRSCTWRSAVPARSCVGYSCTAASRNRAGERVVTCRVDQAEHVTECLAQVVR
jgi:hypothetical protein